MEFLSSVRFPWAFVIAVAIAILVEACLWHERIWFSDLAAWQWQVKDGLMRTEEFDGDVVLIGSSITFHSLNPNEIQLGSDERVTNIALNGLRPVHFLEEYSRYIRNHSHPSVLMVEVRDAEANLNDWHSGPYFRFWGSWQDYLQSEAARKEPQWAIDFLAHRIFASYSYNTSIDNWITSSVSEHGVSTIVRDRNKAVGEEMLQCRGFSKGDFDEPISVIPAPMDRSWKEDKYGFEAFNEIAKDCLRNDVKLVLFRNPLPPFAERERMESEFDRGFADFANKLTESNPGLIVEIFAPRDFALVDFADDHHFTPKGSQKLMREFENWYKARKTAVK